MKFGFSGSRKTKFKGGMGIFMKIGNKEINKKKLIAKLESWNSTFDNVDEDGNQESSSLDKILPKLRQNKQITKKDEDEILFHLKQMEAGK
jgi:hypothetical protein